MYRPKSPFKKRSPKDKVPDEPVPALPPSGNYPAPRDYRDLLKEQDEQLQRGNAFAQMATKKTQQMTTSTSSPTFIKHHSPHADGPFPEFRSTLGAATPYNPKKTKETKRSNVPAPLDLKKSNASFADSIQHPENCEKSSNNAASSAVSIYPSESYGKSSKSKVASAQQEYHEHLSKMNTASSSKSGQQREYHENLSTIFTTSSVSNQEQEPLTGVAKWEQHLKESYKEDPPGKYKQQSVRIYDTRVDDDEPEKAEKKSKHSRHNSEAEPSRPKSPAKKLFQRVKGVFMSSEAPPQMPELYETPNKAVKILGREAIGRGHKSRSNSVEHIEALAQQEFRLAGIDGLHGRSNVDLTAKTRSRSQTSPETPSTASFGAEFSAPSDREIMSYGRHSRHATRVATGPMQRTVSDTATVHHYPLPAHSFHTPGLNDRHASDPTWEATQLAYYDGIAPPTPPSKNPRRKLREHRPAPIEIPVRYQEDAKNGGPDTPDTAIHMGGKSGSPLPKELGHFNGSDYTNVVLNKPSMASLKKSESASPVNDPSLFYLPQTDTAGAGAKSFTTSYSSNSTSATPSFDSANRDPVKQDRETETPSKPPTKFIVKKKKSYFNFGSSDKKKQTPQGLGLSPALDTAILQASSNVSPHPERKSSYGKPPSNKTSYDKTSYADAPKSAIPEPLRPSRVPSSASRVDSLPPSFSGGDCIPGKLAMEALAANNALSANEMLDSYLALHVHVDNTSKAVHGLVHHKLSEQAEILTTNHAELMDNINKKFAMVLERIEVLNGDVVKNNSRLDAFKRELMDKIVETAKLVQKECFVRLDKVTDSNVQLEKSVGQLIGRVVELEKSHNQLRESVTSTPTTAKQTMNGMSLPQMYPSNANPTQVGPYGGPSPPQSTANFQSGFNPTTSYNNGHNAAYQQQQYYHPIPYADQYNTQSGAAGWGGHVIPAGVEKMPVQQRKEYLSNYSRQLAPPPGIHPAHRYQENSRSESDSLGKDGANGV